MPIQNGNHRFAAIRPEPIRLQPLDRNSGIGGLPGQIQTILNRGLLSEITVKASGEMLKSVRLTNSLMETGLRGGNPVYLRIDPDNECLLAKIKSSSPLCR